MKHRGLKLSLRHRWSIYLSGLALLLTGAAWAWLHHRDEAGEASDAMRNLLPWLLKVHGFAALFFVILLGTLLPIHVRHSWHARKNRVNGVFFLTSLGLLTLSGYLLYYLGDENWRNNTSKFHLWLGLAAPLLLLWHIILGRKATSKRHIPLNQP